MRDLATLLETTVNDPLCVESEGILPTPSEWGTSECMVDVAVVVVVDVVVCVIIVLVCVA